MAIVTKDYSQSGGRTITVYHNRGEGKIYYDIERTRRVKEEEPWSYSKETGEAIHPKTTWYTQLKGWIRSFLCKN